MARAAMTFYFKLPEEQQDMMSFVRAQEAMSVLWDVDQELRSKLKHGDDEWLTDEVCDYLDGLRTRIWESGVLSEYH